MYDTVTASYTGAKEWLSRAGVSRQIPGRGYHLNNGVPSHDGRLMLIDRSRTDGAAQVVVMDLTGKVMRIVPHSAGCFPGGFAGSEVVVTCGGTSWHVIAIDSSGRVKTLGPVNPGSSAAVAAGSNLVLAANGTHLYTVPVGGGDPKSVADTGQVGDTGTWTSDGTRIVYLGADASGGRAIFLINADGSEKHKVAGVPFGGDLHLAVSPDDQHILVAGSADTPSQLWAVDANGTHPHYLSDSLEGGDPHSLS